MIEATEVLQRITALARPRESEYDKAALYVKATGASWSSAASKFGLDRPGIIAAAGRMGIGAASQRRGRASKHSFDVGHRVGTVIVVAQEGAQYRMRCDCGREIMQWASQVAVNHYNTCGKGCSIEKPSRKGIAVAWANQHKPSPNGPSRRGRHYGPRHRTYEQRAAAILSCVRGSATGTQRGINGKSRTRRQLTVSLTIADIIEIRLNKRCVYCGEMLGDDRCGLDRLDNARGYERDNVVPCCTECNFARGSRLSHEEFMAIAQTRRAAQARETTHESQVPETITVLQ